MIRLLDEPKIHTAPLGIHLFLAVLESMVCGVDVEFIE
jgi:hypothetical protein